MSNLNVNEVFVVYNVYYVYCNVVVFRVFEYIFQSLHSLSIPSYYSSATLLCSSIPATKRPYLRLGIVPFPGRQLRLRAPEKRMLSSSVSVLNPAAKRLSMFWCILTYINEVTGNDVLH